MAAPFRVYKSGGHWWLRGRYWPVTHLRFNTPAEAVSYAYKHWPWWP